MQQDIHELLAPFVHTNTILESRGRGSQKIAVLVFVMSVKRQCIGNGLTSNQVAPSMSPDQYEAKSRLYQFRRSLGLPTDSASPVSRLAKERDSCKGIADTDDVPCQVLEMEGASVGLFRDDNASISSSERQPAKPIHSIDPTQPTEHPRTIRTGVTYCLGMVSPLSELCFLSILSCVLTGISATCKYVPLSGLQKYPKPFNPRR